jgi:hypothetical protein
MRQTWLLMLVLLAVGLAPAKTLAESAESDAIKAGFIYQFTRFVRWPPTEGSRRRDAFVIAVVGAPAMLEALAALERQARRVGELPIRVERVAEPATIPECSILFVGRGASARLDRILDAVADRPVLVVGDAPGWARRGVAVNFYRQRDRVRFEINPRALRRAGLIAEAQLFDVARIVE